MTRNDLDTFITHYIACALWTGISTDGPDPDDSFEPEDISEELMATIKEDCKAFVEANEADLADLTAEQAGHDFWLTRNGHGAGFWDRGLGDLGDRLSDACKPFGSQDWYAGDDGKLYGM